QKYTKTQFRSQTVSKEPVLGWFLNIGTIHSNFPILGATHFKNYKQHLTLYEDIFKFAKPIMVA
ncbi:hypothetical protein, partial [Lentilactobacillus rapi]|uniref:hypothetical protein n=1 Tax=Lentilactobacillus rapi TaxID=481723 RepID=UPI001FB5449D